MLDMGAKASETAGEANRTPCRKTTARDTVKVRATTPRTASSYAESWTDITATSTRTRTASPEDMATRRTGIILRTGAAGAEAGASMNCRRVIFRLISRKICHLNHFTTQRDTTSRKITPTTTNTGDTRGGKQRGTGQHHGRTSTDMGSRVTREALERAHTATLQAGTVSAILTTTGIIVDSSGRPPEKIIMVFPRLRPTPFTRGSTGTDTGTDTATDTISLWTRGLPSSSSGAHVTSCWRWC